MTRVAHIQPIATGGKPPATGYIRHFQLLQRSFIDVPSRYAPLSGLHFVPCSVFNSICLVYNDQEYTKHYFAGSERICSKLGGGLDLAPIDPVGDGVEALHQNHTEIAQHLINLLMKFANCNPEPEFQTETYIDIDPYLAGIEEQLTRHDPEENRFFYHPDHLGSSSFITDADGEGYQHLQYLPFGELRSNSEYLFNKYHVHEQTAVSQKVSWWSTPYQFTGKEKDDETGYNYFGARYYNSDVSVWLSVDPLADKYPSMSAYMYCAGNPVMLVDPDGREVIVSTKRFKTMRDGTERQLKKFSLRRADRIEKTITVSEMKLIDITGKVSNEKLQETASGIQQEIMSYWNTSNSEASDENGYLTNKRGQKIKATTVFSNDIQVVESMDQISRKDHVIAIVSETTLERHGGIYAEMTLYQGTKSNNIMLTTASNLRTGFGDYAHEFGHMLCLDDVRFYRKGDERNRLMFNGVPIFSFNYIPRLKFPLPKPSYKEFKRANSTTNYIPCKSVRNL